MNSLTRRIATLSRRQPPARQVSTGRVPGPAVHPATQMQITPGAGAGITPMTSLIASDGAMFPATGPGQWDQLYAAGRIK